MKKTCVVAAFVISMLLLSVPKVSADTITDPQIFVQQSGTSPANGPNLITDTSAFVVGVAGSFTLQNPLLVIIGVDGTGTPTVSYSGCAPPSACPDATVGTYGLTANTGTLSSGQDAFTQLGLSSGGSESYTNWSGADATNGFTVPTSYLLYAFALNTNLTSGSPITIDESGAANGSFIIAYDCIDGTGSSTGCSTRGDIGQTVFTNTGLVDTKIPEPATLVLLGTGLLGLMGLGLGRSTSLLGLRN